MAETNTKNWSNEDLQALYNQAYPNSSAAGNPATLAKGQTDVDAMTVRDRLWDSMNYTYGQQRKASDQAYANALSQQDRQALARGMQRSSYNNATAANLRNQQVEAQNNIYAQQIADYEKALYQIERDQVADQQWQTQFDESVRQFNVLHPQDTGGGGGGGGYTARRGSGKGTTKTTTTSGDGLTLDFGKAAGIAGAIAGGVSDLVSGFASKASNAIGKLFPWQ